MKTKELKKWVIKSLEDMKAQDICVLNVIKTSNFTDVMIICSGRSSRQVKAIAIELVSRAKLADMPPIGVEGETTGAWVLVDLGDVVVHVMQPKTRDFYQLEKLWDPKLASEPPVDNTGL